MKKITKLILIICICIISLSCSSCGPEKLYPELIDLTSFYENMKEANNYRYEYTYADTLIASNRGSIASGRFDNGKYCGSFSSIPSYFETIGDEVYFYHHLIGRWTKHNYTESVQDFRVDTDIDYAINNKLTLMLFNAENYQAVENQTNTYKASNILFEDVNVDITAVINDYNTCTFYITPLTAQSLTMCVIFTEIGSVSITLPEVEYDYT